MTTLKNIHADGETVFIVALFAHLLGLTTGLMVAVL